MRWRAKVLFDHGPEVWEGNDMPDDVTKVLDEIEQSAKGAEDGFPIIGSSEVLALVRVARAAAKLDTRAYVNDYGDWVALSDDIDALGDTLTALARGES